MSALDDLGIGHMTPQQRDVARYVWLWEGACPGSMRLDLWCGCGEPETIYLFIRDALRALPWYEPAGVAFWAPTPKGAQHMLAGVLDRLGLVEHGGSWYGARITPLGARAMAAFDLTDEALADAIAVSSDVKWCQVEDCPNCKAFGTAP